MSIRSQPRSHLGARAVAVLTFIALVAAACSGTAASPATGGGATTTGGASGGNPEASVVAGAGGPLASIVSGVISGMPDINPCTMITKADAQALFTAQLADGKTDHLGKCEYRLVDPSLGDGLAINVFSGSDFRFGYDQLMSATGSAGVNTLAGVGDQAKWTLIAGYFPQVEAIKGQVGCDVSAAGGNGQLKVATTGKQMFAVIDPAALDGYMAQFGALCNLVFAANPPGQ